MSLAIVPVMDFFDRLKATLPLDRLFGGASVSASDCPSCAQPLRAAALPQPADEELDRLQALVLPLTGEERPHCAPLEDIVLLDVKALTYAILSRPDLTDKARDVMQLVSTRLMDRSPEQGTALALSSFATLENRTSPDSYMALHFLRQIHWVATSTFTGHQEIGEKARRFVLGSPDLNDGIVVNQPAVAALVDCIRSDEQARIEKARKDALRSAPAAP